MQDVPLRCLGLKGIKESALYPGLLKKLIKIGGSPVGKSQVMRYLTLVHPSTKWFNITGKVVQNDRAVGSNASVYTTFVSSGISSFCIYLKIKILFLLTFALL